MAARILQKIKGIIFLYGYLVLGISKNTDL